MQKDPTTSTLLDKPFFAGKRQLETPATVKAALDVTDRSSRTDSGVRIVVAMALRTKVREHTMRDIHFGITKGEDGFGVRRTLEDIVTGKMADGSPCFTENERFGFGRTYGLTVDVYRSAILEMVGNFPTVAALAGIAE